MKATPESLTFTSTHELAVVEQGLHHLDNLRPQGYTSDPLITDLIGYFSLKADKELFEPYTPRSTHGQLARTATSLAIMEATTHLSKTTPQTFSEQYLTDTAMAMVRTLEAGRELAYQT